MKTDKELQQIIYAANNMDWGQVVLNGGPPCFHLEVDGYFCGRAKRWAGHDAKGIHNFVSLVDLIKEATSGGRVVRKEE